MRVLGCAELMRVTTAALLIASVAAVAAARQVAAQTTGATVAHYLYVAVPGTDADVTDRGAVGILVFDIDNGHKFVRRISPWSGRVRQGEQVRGIAVHVATRRLYLSTVERLAAIDLVTERVLWEKSYDGRGCDRLDLSPDGKTIYAPSFGRPAWHVINAVDGGLITTISVAGFPRQTIYSHDGKLVYLAAWESAVISVVDTATHKPIREVGPFTNFVCPFTINGRETLVFANVDGLVGFEVGDLQTGLPLDRVIVDGSEPSTWEKYECPSHGIALTHDESELWVADGVDNRFHIYDAKTYPPVISRTIDVRGQPRWITFSIDGRYAYPSNGDVIERASMKVVASLEDEQSSLVQSEKMIEIDFSGRNPVRASDQVATGGKR
jgi:hypothetical protein